MNDQVACLGVCGSGRWLDGLSKGLTSCISGRDVDGIVAYILGYGEAIIIDICVDIGLWMGNLAAIHQSS